MTFPLPVQLGAFAVIVIAGYGVERRLGTTDPLLSVPHAVRVLAVGLALAGPFVLVNRGVVTKLFGFDELVVGLSLSLVLYAVVTPLVGRPARNTGGTDGHAQPDD